MPARVPAPRIWWLFSSGSLVLAGDQRTVAFASLSYVRKTGQSFHGDPRAWAALPAGLIGTLGVSPLLTAALLSSSVRSRDGNSKRRWSDILSIVVKSLSPPPAHSREKYSECSETSIRLARIGEFAAGLVLQYVR